MKYPQREAGALDRELVLQRLTKTMRESLDDSALADYENSQRPCLPAQYVSLYDEAIRIERLRRKACGDGK